MGSSWTLLTLFLVYSYPNERLGLLSRRLLEPLSKVSLTSPEGLGLLSATSRLGIRYAYRTPIVRLCYAKLSCNFGYNHDIPWICQLYSYDSPTYFLFYYKSFAPFLPPTNDLATTFQRPCNKIARNVPFLSKNSCHSANT